VVKRDEKPKKRASTRRGPARVDAGVRDAVTRQRETWAALIAVVVAAPLVYMFASAIADGQVRAHEAPMRALLGADAYGALASGERTSMHYMGNDRLAPDFTLRDRSGRAWRLSDHRGKVVVLNFWSITCPPCLEEMPTLVDLANLVDGRDDVELVSVSTDAGWREVASVFPRDMTLEVLFDPDKSVVRGKFGTRLYPETWFIDPDGVIRLRIDGPRDWSEPIVLELIDSLRG
jgi:peroxiredoxin